ncbi:MAG: Mu-like prophage major head subunit gpT family protein [Bauldia sp.]
MLINSANLDAIRVGFSTAFQGGQGLATSQYARVSMQVPATLKEQKYGWLKDMPGPREWVGPRAVHNLAASDYTIREKPWELTVAVDRDDIETDNLGIYTPMFTAMGQSTGSQWEQLVWALLKAGFATTCYDGQNFFDTDHPVLDAAGATQQVANTDSGSGTPWFLLDVSKVYRPIILQKRRDFQFVAKDRLEDDNVFDNKEFRYGADARGNVGFGFWQLAWGSKQTLDATHYAAGRSAISSMKSDYGRPLGLTPNLLVVPPSLESAGRKLLNSEYASGGETNEWKGTAELLVVPWLA